MKAKIVVIAAFVAVIALPVSAFAATYGYINTQGQFATVTANSAAEALVTPTDIHHNSGVILMKQTMVTPSIVISVPPTLTVGSSTTMVYTATSSTMMATTSVTITALGITTATSTIK